MLNATEYSARRALTIEEAAGVLGIGRSSAYAAARAGSLPTVRVGRRLLVPIGRLDAMLGETNENSVAVASRDAVNNSAAGIGHHEHSHD